MALFGWFRRRLRRGTPEEVYYDLLDAGYNPDFLDPLIGTFEAYSDETCPLCGIGVVIYCKRYLLITLRGPWQEAMEASTCYEKRCSYCDYRASATKEEFDRVVKKRMRE